MISIVMPMQGVILLLGLLILKLPEVCLQRLIDFTTIDPACDTMIPTINRNVIGSTNESNFRIRIFDENGKETYEYDVKNQRILYVKVEGGPFVRAHIQARSVAHPTVQVGSFVAPPPEYFKLVNCSGVYGAAIINEDYVTRRHTGVRWRPPTIAKGAIVFLASIIHSKKLFHIRSAFLSPYTNFITVRSDECGRSHGCFKAGDDGCAFADTCRFSFKWRCYKNSMIVDAVHNGKLTSFGLSIDEEYAVMCVSRKSYVTAEDFIVVSGNGFPNIFRAPRSKRLKAIRDSRRVYCRLVMRYIYINQLINFL
uniref:Reelin domain-containing protein n=1 Tax=Ascaris lumbricoides TaxID=6252 RepID=A0A9J2P5S4_ASCLU